VPERMGESGRCADGGARILAAVEIGSSGAAPAEAGEVGHLDGPAIQIPVGLVVLVGPPASGKSTFAAELVRQGKVDTAALVSSDDIAVEMFGPGVDREVADPQIFEERDRRVAQRLTAGLCAVVDATNVLPHARARLATIAQLFGAPVVVLRFPQPQQVLLTQNDERDRNLPARQVREHAALMARHATDAQLRVEGAWAVHDVPGRDQQVTPAQAAHRFTFV
jgi:predicted kinase